MFKDKEAHTLQTKVYSSHVTQFWPTVSFCWALPRQLQCARTNTHVHAAVICRGKSPVTAAHNSLLYSSFCVIIIKLILIILMQLLRVFLMCSSDSFQVTAQLFLLIKCSKFGRFNMNIFTQQHTPLTVMTGLICFILMYMIKTQKKMVKIRTSLHGIND